jgi:hypothetical protein
MSRLPPKKDGHSWCSWCQAFVPHSEDKMFKLVTYNKGALRSDEADVDLYCSKVCLTLEVTN